MLGVDVAVLVKQVPAADSLALGEDGRLRRAGLPAEMNPFCRRAVAKAVELARSTGGRCTAVTMGPPSAEDTVREAVAHGADLGVVVTDPALAGADTLATARTLATVLGQLGPFDLVLVGRNSVDADTGQVGPQVAELLGLPFVAAVRQLAVAADRLEVLSERDDGWRRVTVTLPAVVSTAERLTDPAKHTPDERRAVPADRIRLVGVTELGPGPWGAAGSPTRVGAVRSISVARAGQVLTGPVVGQVAAAVAMLVERGQVERGPNRGPVERGPGRPSTASIPTAGGATEVGSGAVGTDDRGVGRTVAGAGDRGFEGADAGAVPAAATDPDGPVVAVLAEPDHGAVTRQLLGEAAVVAHGLRGQVLVVGPRLGVVPPFDELAIWGADRALAVTGSAIEEDVARAVGDRWASAPPWAVLAPATHWGREVASRLAARLGAGLTGDAVGVGVADGRLVCAKPALGGQLVAEVTAAGVPQMATVRPGILPLRRPRPLVGRLVVDDVAAAAAGRVTVVDEQRDDEVGVLSAATAIVCVGQGVAPDDYPLLEPLVRAVGGVLGATRKVTDKGWLPRSRQIGITGHSVAPSLLVLIGVSGALNHMVATRGAGTIVAINHDPDAKVFAWADVGLVADWRQVVGPLADALAAEGAVAVAD